MSAERNAEIVRRRDAGERPADIARNMRLSRGVVAGALFRAGRTDSDSRKARGRTTNFSHNFREEVVRWSKVLNQSEAARKFGVHPSAVSKWCRRYA